MEEGGREREELGNMGGKGGELGTGEEREGEEEEEKRRKGEGKIVLLLGS